MLESTKPQSIYSYTAYYFSYRLYNTELIFEFSDKAKSSRKYHGHKVKFNVHSMRFTPSGVS